MGNDIGHFIAVRDDIPEDFRIAYLQLAREKDALLASNAALEKSNVNLRHELALALRLKFAHKTEKWTHDDRQLALVLNEAEKFAPVQPLEEEFRAKLDEAVTRTPKSRRHKKPGRPAIDSNLPREIQTIDIAPGQKTCACGHEMSRIGEDTREQIDYIPAHLRVLKTVYPKYACAQCKGLSDVAKPAVVSAARDPEILPRGNATAGLLAYIAICKFMDHIPLYRLERVFARLKLTLSRATMSLWMVVVGKKLRRLVALMRADMMRCDYIAGDETTHQVLNEIGRKNEQLSYVWAFRAKYQGRPIAIYKYHPTRAGTVVVNFVKKEFKGSFQSDAYSAYNVLADKRPSVSLVGCWAHARRGFKEAWDRAASAKSAEILGLIGDLYKVEEKLKETNADYESIAKMRDEFSRPLYGELKRVLEITSAEILPKSDLGKATAYTLRIWNRLGSYLDDPKLDIDNNMIENQIRPIALGRKNIMFFGGPRGAVAGMAWYSLIQSAIANGLEPSAYLTYVLNTMPKCRTKAEYMKLLPHRIDVSLIASESGKN